MPIVTVMLVDPVQPTEFVAVTVYVVVVFGLAVTVAPVVDDKSAEGAHK